MAAVWSAGKQWEVILGIVIFNISLFASTGYSEYLESQQFLKKYWEIPSEYGEIIYRVNTDSAKQLFIVGISHRNPDSGANGDSTVQTQIEIFHIGAWLNKTMHLSLLLPEGYFQHEEQTVASPLITIEPSGESQAPLPDNTELNELLSSKTSFINAEMLLMKYLPFHASQVEDREAYSAVRSSLGRLNEAIKQHVILPKGLVELKYLQEVRTFRILQNIPVVISNELKRGTIESSTALFTIGLNHIEGILRILEKQKIHNVVPPEVEKKYADTTTPSVDLLDKGYGITIILPRTLADDQEILEKTRISKILLRTGEPSHSF